MPPGDWATLPDDVRAEALHLADKRTPHPDPAIAATVVAAARAERRRTNLQLRILTWPAAVITGGGVIGLILLGGTIHDAGTRDTPIIVAFLLGLVVLAGGGGALSWLDRRRRPAPPPETADIPNLRFLLLQASRPALPNPLTIRRRHTWLLTLLTAAPFATGLGYVLARHTGRPFDLRHGFSAVIFGLAATTIAGLVNRHRRPERSIRRRAPMPIRITDDGLRFGRFRRSIPWSDALGVYLTDSGLEWALRDRPRLVLSYDATRVPAEEIVLTARAYHERQRDLPSDALAGSTETH